MEMIGQMAAVAGVLILLFGTLWWLRRKGFATRLPAMRPARRNLECLERLPLGPQHALHLIRLGETALLVASSPGGCALVQSFPCDRIEPRKGIGR